MKLKQLTFAIAASSFVLFSCNDAKKDTTVTTTDTLVAEPVAVTTVAQQAERAGSAVVITTDKVPDTIRTSFVTKYPKAKTVEWYSYAPVPEDELVMDDQYYYVRYNNNGADYTSWYNNRGDWVKTSTKVPGNSKLPDAVNRYLNVTYPDYTIEEINKENDKDMDMYEIKLNKGESKVKLKILPNGEVFKRKVK
jgi:hypothetical protein